MLHRRKICYFRSRREKYRESMKSLLKNQLSRWSTREVENHGLCRRRKLSHATRMTNLALTTVPASLGKQFGRGRPITREVGWWIRRINFASDESGAVNHNLNFLGIVKRSNTTANWCSIQTRATINMESWIRWTNRSAERGTSINYLTYTTKPDNRVGLH